MKCTTLRDPLPVGFTPAAACLASVPSATSAYGAGWQAPPEQRPFQLGSPAALDEAGTSQEGTGMERWLRVLSWCAAVLYVGVGALELILADGSLGHRVVFVAVLTGLAVLVL